MSDVESTSAASVGEGSAGSTEASAPVGEGVGAAPVAAPGEGKDIAAKIAKHKAGAAKGGPAIDSGAQVGGASAVKVTGSAEGVNTQAVAEQAPVFTPNYKFTFRGKEQDIPELYRQLIKDAETERQVRELHEKAMWFEETKPRYMEASQQLSGLTKGLNVLDGYVQKKDLGKVFSTLGLTDDDLFTYAKQRLDYHQMPPEQQHKLDSDYALQERAAMLEQQNADLIKQQVDYSAQHKDQQLRSIMQHPSISPVVERHPGGSTGFYQDVAQYAWYVEQSTGQDLTPEQAVLSYIQYRNLGTQPAATAPVAPPQTPQAPAPRAPTLPTVPGQGTSPAKKMVSSMKDLRAAKDRAMAQYGD